jgi:transcription initiation factor TFIIE subunit beta
MRQAYAHHSFPCDAAAYNRSFTALLPRVNLTLILTVTDRRIRSPLPSSLCDSLARRCTSSDCTTTRNPRIRRTTSAAMSFLKANSASRVNAPSPTPSNTSASGAKRKRPAEGSAVVYSQPIDQGTGEHVYTRFTYTVNHLREANKWLPFEEIMKFLGVRAGDPQREQLRTLFRSDSEGNRIMWNASNDTYRYKPKLDIRNRAQLKGYLQNQKSAQGLSIKDLKDGWATVADDIKGMEDRKEVLVKRAKDGVAKIVWDNDPTLMHPMDPEFLHEWHKIAIPANPDDLRATLMNVGLHAASAPRQVNNGGPKQKKKRAARRGGKQTNTHMMHILKDFSGMRK